MKFNELKKEYDEFGYVKINNFLSKDEITTLIKHLNNLDDNVIRYFDNENRLRRIEKIAYREEFSVFNNKILSLLEKIFVTKMILFKDKYHVKPPLGEGFFAHYDSVFTWEDENGNKKRGWYEYCEDFYNVLIAIDECNEENGTIEIANKDTKDLSYDEIFKRTHQDSSGGLTSELEKSTKFNYINLNPGDIVIFSDKCPHRSKKNNSLTSDRRILYFTYNKESDGNHYDKYFYDKYTSKESANISKGLSSKAGK